MIGNRAFIMSKLEKPAAIDCLDEIVGRSDGIMVARGELGVEMPPEQAFTAAHHEEPRRDCVAAYGACGAYQGHSPPTRDPASRAFARRGKGPRRPSEHDTLGRNSAPSYLRLVCALGRRRKRRPTRSP